MARNWENHHLNASLHVADSLSNEDCKFLVVPAAQNSIDEYQCFCLKDIIKKFQVAKKSFVAILLKNFQTCFHRSSCSHKS